MTTVSFLDEVDSTSNELWRRIETGTATAGAVVAAWRQTAGRGRHGRSWHSPRGGNLYVSLALAVGGAPARSLPLVPLAAGVAAAAVVRVECGADVRLKWPNDLLISDRKVGGILCEAKDPAASPVLAVVGLGLNTGRSEFPAELSDVAISLSSVTSAAPAPERIAAEWIGSLEGMIARLEEPDISWLLDDWRSLAEPFGRRVRAAGLEGRTVDLDRDGRLIIQLDDGSTRRIAGGEVERIG